MIVSRLRDLAVVSVWRLERLPASMSPSLSGLAQLWENNEFVRRQLVHHGSLLKWPKPECCGVISLEALSHNFDVLWACVDIWASQRSEPKCLPVNPLKKEVLTCAFNTVFCCSFPDLRACRHERARCANFA